MTALHVRFQLLPAKRICYVQGGSPIHLGAEQICLEQAECPQEKFITPSSQVMAVPGTSFPRH